MADKMGLAQSLTSYGDADFALYLRRSFARSMGYSSAMLERPVIGIADTDSPAYRAGLRTFDVITHVAENY